jgi:hypothetical protein
MTGTEAKVAIGGNGIAAQPPPLRTGTEAKVAIGGNGDRGLASAP